MVGSLLLGVCKLLVFEKLVWHQVPSWETSGVLQIEYGKGVHGIMDFHSGSN